MYVVRRGPFRVVDFSQTTIRSRYSFGWVVQIGKDFSAEDAQIKWLKLNYSLCGSALNFNPFILISLKFRIFFCMSLVVRNSFYLSLDYSTKYLHTKHCCTTWIDCIIMLCGNEFERYLLSSLFLHCRSHWILKMLSLRHKKREGGKKRNPYKTTWNLVNLCLVSLHRSKFNHYFHSFWKIHFRIQKNVNCSSINIQHVYSMNLKNFVENPELIFTSILKWGKERYRFSYTKMWKSDNVLSSKRIS